MNATNSGLIVNICTKFNCTCTSSTHYTISVMHEPHITGYPEVNCSTVLTLIPGQCSYSSSYCSVME